jgi:rhodanese-related sulfurtransferase
MTARQETVAEGLRISVDEVKARLQSGEPVTMLDVRNDNAWEASQVKIAGAGRARPAEWHIDASWPKGQLTVVYWTWPNEQNSARVAQFLRERGFREAYALRSGLDAWQAAGGPVEAK